MNIKEKCKKILEHYGEEAQANQYLEELGELFVGLVRNDLENIKEEIADVEVMVEQFKMFVGIDIRPYERIKKRFDYDGVDSIEWIEREFKLCIIDTLDYIMNKNIPMILFRMAQIEGLIKRYIKLKEIDIQDIEKIKEQKIDRQLKRIEREKIK